MDKTKKNKHDKDDKDYKNVETQHNEDDKNKVLLTQITMKRLLKDISNIMINPLNEHGIYYCHDEYNILKGYALIIGNENTPYNYGNYLFEFSFPYNYPFSPPNVKFIVNDGVTRFNPNLYKCGKVCLSILNTWNGDKWSSCQNISSILLSLCTILNNKPLLNEPGENEYSSDFTLYNKVIKYKNIEFTIYNLINNFKQLYPKFIFFYPIIIDNFIKNYPKIMKIIEDIDRNERIYSVYVEIYRMSIFINYDTLQKKIKFMYDNHTGVKK